MLTESLHGTAQFDTVPHCMLVSWYMNQLMTDLNGAMSVMILMGCSPVQHSWFVHPRELEGMWIPCQSSLCISLLKNSFSLQCYHLQQGWLHISYVQASRGHGYHVLITKFTAGSLCQGQWRAWIPGFNDKVHYKFLMSRPPEGLDTGFQ